MVSPVAKMKMRISLALICNKWPAKKDARLRSGFSLIEVVVALAILAFAFHTLLQTALAVSSSSQYSRGRELIFLQARTAAADHFSGISKVLASEIPERYDSQTQEFEDKDKEAERVWTQYAFSDREREMPIVSFALQVVER